MAARKRHYVLYGWCHLPTPDDSDSNILCPVGSAELTVQPESKLDNGPHEFYVDIMLDQMRLKATQAMEGHEALSWNEWLTLYAPSYPDYQFIK
jgi:hypothetical protein